MGVLDLTEQTSDCIRGMQLYSYFIFFLLFFLCLTRNRLIKLSHDESKAGTFAPFPGNRLLNRDAGNSGFFPMDLSLRGCEEHPPLIPGFVQIPDHLFPAFYLYLKRCRHL